MSHFNDFETNITDKGALLRALVKCINGYGEVIKENWIEVHDEPQNLYGYKGDIRNQKAHIIIRRNHVGHASNDIGFVRDAEGNYSATISDYDVSSHYNANWRGRLQMHYNIEKSKMELEAKGIPYTETKDEKGRIQLRAKFQAETTSRIQVRR